MSTKHNLPDGDGAPWNCIVGGGPVVATAIHAGHVIRKELEPSLAIEAEDRRREEDPLTDYFLSLSDNLVRVNRSRFECDMNRPREKCISDDPDDTWGLKIWRDDLSGEQKETSRQLHDRFYGEMRSLFDGLLEKHGRLLVLDIHSYNHRRDGPAAEPADERENPDIDIGATTLDKSVFGELLNVFTGELAKSPVRGRLPTVGENIRYPDGGNFPEWLFDVYGKRACVMTLEYKKIFMDEWTGALDIGAVQDLRTGLMHALRAARRELEEMNR